MARPGGKEVGRVSIRVIPDATKFRNDLKLLLKRVEQSMSANIMVDADTRPAEASVRRVIKKFNGEKASIEVGADTIAASAQLKYVSRTRVVPLQVRVNKASLTVATAALTKLASLSGGRLVGDVISNVGEKLSNLDRSLPKLAAIALSITSITAAALGSIGGLATLGASLASIAGIGLVLPGIFAGAAVGGITLAIALSSAGDQLKSLAPTWARLKKIITDNFWERARKPILDLVQGLLPQLRIGLTDTSRALGDWAASVVSSFQVAFSGGVLQQQFAFLSESIRIASTGTDQFAASIATLGTVGASYLPRLATWVNDLALTFNGWLQAAEGDGRLQTWIERALVATQQLGSVIASTSGILYGFFTAAEAAGGGGLATLASTLATVAGIVNSPVFQSTLGTLFEGAAGGVSGLTTALGPIGAMLTALAPTLSFILENAGELVGTLAGGIADALSTPAFEVGLSSFFDGIQDGLLAILPALPSLAAALGSVGAFAGQLASTLGPVLGAAFVALVPVLQATLDALEPILPILGDALVQAITDLAPSLTTLITELAPSLPGIVQLLADLLPSVTSLISILTTPTGSGTSVLDAIVAGLDWLVKSNSGFLTFIDTILQGVSAVDLISGALSGKFGPILQWATEIGVGFGTTLGKVFEGIPILVQSALGGLRSIISSVFNRLIDLVNGVIGGINDVAAGVKTISGGAIDIKLGKLPHVPSLATGATIRATQGGSIVRVGEGGRDEAVVDYGLVNGLLEKSLNRDSRGYGDITIPVTAAPGEDPRLTARVVGRELEDIMAGR